MLMMQGSAKELGTWTSPRFGILRYAALLCPGGEERHTTTVLELGFSREHGDIISTGRRSSLVSLTLSPSGNVGRRVVGARPGTRRSSLVVISRLDLERHDGVGSGLRGDTRELGEQRGRRHFVAPLALASSRRRGVATRCATTATLVESTP